MWAYKNNKYPQHEYVKFRNIEYMENVLRAFPQKQILTLYRDGSSLFLCEDQTFKSWRMF